MNILRQEGASCFVSSPQFRQFTWHRSLSQYPQSKLESGKGTMPPLIHEKPRCLPLDETRNRQNSPVHDAEKAASARRRHMGICRIFWCCTMRILDREGLEVGDVKGRCSLSIGDRLLQCVGKRRSFRSLACPTGDLMVMSLLQVNLSHY